MTIIENQKNADNNGNEMFIGEAVNQYSVDLTGNGDRVTFTEYSNDVWVCEDDLMSHTHFTLDVEATIEGYIDEEECVKRKEKFEKMLSFIMCK